MTKTMNVLLATNDNFADYVVVLLNSLYKNHKENRVDTYILHMGLTDKSIREIEKFGKVNKQNVFFICMEKYKKQIMKWGANSPIRWGEEAYLRLFAHIALPKEVDRCLYLDIDTIVNKNVLDFYMQDFDDNFLVVSSQYVDYKRSLNEKMDRKFAMTNTYFNSGVLLMNLNKFRKEISLESYQEAIKAFNRIPPDQQLLNYMFFDKAKYVNQYEYNFRYSSCYNSNQRKRIGEIYGVAPENIRHMPFIIHYTYMVNFGKPWDLYFDEDELSRYKRDFIAGVGGIEAFVINEENNYLAGVWWKYAKDTPVYEKLYYEMKVKKEWYKRHLDWVISKFHIIAKQNVDMKNNLEVWKNKCESLEKKFNEISKVEDKNNKDVKYSSLSEEKVNRFSSNDEEIYWSCVYNNSIVDSKWLLQKAISPGGGNRTEVGYEFLYYLYRGLDEFKPKSILELGLGQATKLTGQYALHNKVSHCIIDYDKNHADSFFENWIYCVKSASVYVTPQDYTYNTDEYYAFKHFDEIIKAEKYNLILSICPHDGTVAHNHDLINKISDLICPDFMIFIDHTEKARDIITRIETVLTKNNISFRKKAFVSSGREFSLFTSESWGSLLDF